MGAPNEILDLVNRFHEQYDSYRSPSYNEAQVRQEFVNPFFKALGWDVDNEQGYAEAYKDVIHEDSIKVGASTKAPDYSFRIGGVRKFFVETKKPAVNVGQDVSPAYQLRRYAWSAKLPLSILTDFEEFAVYDCRVRPDKNDKASTARTLYSKYEQYDDHWDEIASIFSRDAILKGSFDKYAESTKKKRGTAEVDDAFLKEIEQWRSELARNLALRNPELSQRELNSAVQKTIDRIIFLRICEDRGIEPYGGLQSLPNGPNIYPRLCELFRRADDRYNSGLFHFTKEKSRNEEPDEWTLSLEIDDRVLKDITRKLYYPESPYEFSVLGADILGQVYEQFLGKVIRLTKGHQAKVEDKPEVKKAGGVYYTPTYIVDYIVEQTVGKLLEGKTPHEVAARTKTTWKRSKRGRPLSVLDPACGSGSFLIGAYQHLLDWYRDWYVENDPAKHKDRIYQTRQDQWRLTTAERKRILLEHIYGVDIDPQAVEVTKLSLLLKVLEGETKETLQRQLFAKQRALPDLADNIKCGNSLIGPDFYQGREEQLDLFDEDERLRINVFDWQAEFREIMQSGGFDAVIGNPPYVDVKILGDDIKSVLAERFESATRRFDLYIPFVEQGLQLVRDGGLLAYIMPSMFARRDYGRDLRSVIASLSRLRTIVDFGSNQVFYGPMNYVGIFVIQRTTGQCDVDVVRCDRSDLDEVELQQCMAGESVQGVTGFRLEAQRYVTHDEWYFRSSAEIALVERAYKDRAPLEALLRNASEGIHSGKDAVFFLPTARAQQLRLESPPVHPLAKGKDVHRYDAIDPSHLPNTVIYPYDLTSGRVIPGADLAQRFPNTWNHLEECRQTLRGRPYFDRSGKNWYELWCPRDPALYTTPKIVGPEIAIRGEFTLVEAPLFINNKLKGLIPRDDARESIHYLLALLNSSVLVYLHRLIAPPKGGNFFEVKTRVMGKLPIHRLNLDVPEERALHDKIVALVKHMLRLKKQSASAKTTHERTALARQVEATDREIDRLVYELYGLTDEEIRIVEEATAR